MTVDPTRLAHDPDAPEALRALFAAARPARPLGSRAHARVLAELDRMPEPAGPRAARLFLAVVVPASLLAVAAAVLIGLQRTAPIRDAAGDSLPAIATPAPPAPPSPVAVDPVAVDTEPASEPAAGPEPQPSTRAEPTVRPGRAPDEAATALVPARDPPADEAAPVTTDLDAEASLLGEARDALHDDPAASLRALDRHRQRFGGGQLEAERETIAVDALRRLGRYAEARARGEAALRRWPDGLYAAKVRELLSQLP